MEHPITPPDELVRQWRQQWLRANPDQPCGPSGWQSYMAGQSAQWCWEQRGAATEAELQKARDEELKGCEEWVAIWISAPEAAQLYAARRPKAPSLKEQALEQLKCIDADLRKQGIINTDKIRLALEQLDD